MPTHEPTSHDFMAHHAPWGAYCNFMLGKIGAGGGFALSDVHSPNQSVYIGVQRGTATASVLPFLGFTGKQADDFSTGASDTGQDRGFRMVGSHEFGREYRFASDTWTLDGLRFTIHSPAPEVPALGTLSEVQRKQALCPCVIATLEYDNRNGSETARVLFALEGITRALETDSHGALLGSAHRRAWGMAARAQDGLREIQAFDVLTQAFAPHAAFPPNTLRHMLGTAGGLLLEVPAGTTGRMIVALGAHQPGVVTSGQDARYAYSDDFATLEAALEFALDHAERTLALSRERDAELERSGLDANQQFLVAHGTHSYLASTELLRRESDGRLLWIVNEGEYRMMNTLDLAVDLQFFESRYHPWTTANMLEHFLERYGFHDTLKGGGVGGLSFPHDMGVSNAFAPPGESSYELPELDGCFSHMTSEQLLNWTLCATMHGLRHDTAWLERHAQALQDCRDSILNRDRDGDGVMDSDSARVGSGMELTTYDNVDEALGRARASAYLAGKTWAALELLAQSLERIGLDGSSARDRAANTASTIVRVANASANGALPPHLDTATHGEIVHAIPAIEGLAYAIVMDFAVPGELRDALCKHHQAALANGCVTPRGGWQLSSGSENTWMSKIFLNQIVAEYLGVPPEARSHAEHARWQWQGSNDTCATDQVRSSDGLALGSKLYPRLVTSILWLEHASGSTRATAAALAHA